MTTKRGHIVLAYPGRQRPRPSPVASERPGESGGRLRLRDAEAVYGDERTRARWRLTLTLLRQERSWRRVADPTDAERLRLKALRDELTERGVRLAPRQNPW